jgi:hypothetical protein
LLARSAAFLTRTETCLAASQHPGGPSDAPEIISSVDDGSLVGRRIAIYSRPRIKPPLKLPQKWWHLEAYGAADLLVYGVVRHVWADPEGICVALVEDDDGQLVTQALAGDDQSSMWSDSSRIEAWTLIEGSDPVDDQAPAHLTDRWEEVTNLFDQYRESEP